MYHNIDEYNLIDFFFQMKMGLCIRKKEVVKTKNRMKIKRNKVEDKNPYFWL